MMDPKINKKISDTIIHYLKNGLRVDADVIDYSMSTLGLSTIDEIGEILTSDDPHTDGIIDLVLFPDHGIRLEIEPLLPSVGLEKPIIEESIEKITQKTGRANIIFEKSDYSVSIQLSRDMVKDFITKLNMDRDISFTPSVDAMDQKNLKKIIEARIKLRNTKYHSTPQRADFLFHILETLIPDQNVDITLLVQCLDFLLKLFSENKTDSNFHKMIAMEKRSWQKSLDMASRFNEDLKKYSMDFLMLQRVTPPVITPEEAELNIKIADLIRLAAFGIKAEFREGSNDQDIEIDSINEKNFSRIFKLLS